MTVRNGTESLDKPATARLSADIIDLTLDRVEVAIHGPGRAAGARAIQRLRELIDSCVPDPAATPAPALLSEILGMVVTLDYPFTQLERYLSAQPSDITEANQAESYLSFVRYHVWKLEHLIRETAARRA